MSDRRLKSCPVCDYSLQGLPDHHACPECGFAYDKSMQVIVQSTRYAGFAFVFFGLLSGSMAVGIIRHASWIASFMLLGSIGAIIVGFRTYVLQRRNKAVVGPTGIFLMHQNGAIEEFSWDDVGSAAYNKLGGGAKLLTADGQKLRTVDYVFFGADRPAREFIALVNGSKPKHGVSQAEDDTPEIGEIGRDDKPGTAAGQAHDRT